MYTIRPTASDAACARRCDNTNPGANQCRPVVSAPGTNPEVNKGINPEAIHGRCQFSITPTLGVPYSALTVFTLFTQVCTHMADSLFWCSSRRGCLLCCQVNINGLQSDMPTGGTCSRTRLYLKHNSCHDKSTV